MRIFLLASPLLTATPTVWAGGGYGSVNAVEVTENEIRINWTPPSDKYKAATSPPKYEICYKEARVWKGSCAKGEVEYTIQRPYLIEGLEAGERYKIKVFAYAEKKNWRGKFKNAKYRKVGTLTQSTASPEPRVGNVRLSSAGETSIEVEVAYSAPGDFDLIRACYKVAWSLDSLSKCRDRSSPEDDWEQSNDRRGWIDLEPPQGVQSFEFLGLKSCHQYVVMAVGFRPNSTTGVRIGERTKGHTGAACKTTYAGSVLDDHLQIATEYAGWLEEFYQAPLIDGVSVALQTRDLYVAERELAQDEVDLRDAVELLTYLDEERPDLFERWQSGEELRAASGDIESFLAVREPRLHQELLDEVGDDSTVGTIETAGKSSVTFIVEGFHQARGFGIHISPNPRMDGFGGRDAELHLLVSGEEGAARILLLGYDGFLDDENHANEFRMDLGAQDRISHLILTVSRRMVSAVAVVFARSPAQIENETARKTYTLTASFPIREVTGFFRNSPLHYKVNGVLNGRTDREGSGYVLSDPEVR